MSKKAHKPIIAGLLASGLALGGGSVLSASVAGNAVQPAPSIAASSGNQSSMSPTSSRPMLWHLVIRIAMTKAGCDNIKRIMPNSGNLKCVKAGKVWVLIPKGMGY